MNNFTAALLAFGILLTICSTKAACPLDVTPCTCLGGTTLICTGVGLSDTKASSILQKFIPAATILTSVVMNNNALTTVPLEIEKLTSLTTVDLSGNKITVVRAKSFNFASPSVTLKLDSNTLGTISPGAFLGTGYGSESTITLTGNNLTSFTSGVFQSVLESKTNVDMLGNKIDCSEAKLCDLAWLVRDNKDLLPYVKNGVCSNGTALSALTVGSFDVCPMDCTTEDNGNHADPLLVAGTCSSKFYQCSNKVTYTFDCNSAGTNLIFNPTTKVCDALANVPECKLPDIPFVCPSASGNFPKTPADCSNYWVCVDCEAYEQKCPTPLVFNPAKSQCDKVSNVPSCNVKKLPFKLFK